MKKVFIIGLVLNVLALQAQDYERLNERSPMGTARYVGMAGAMTAVGADPSAAADNPAGLGFYRHSELLFSIGGAFDRTCQEGLTISGRKNKAIVPQASIVFAFGERFTDYGAISNAVMFSYRRTHDFSRRVHLVGIESPSLGHLLNEEGVNLGISYPTYPLNTGYDQLVFESGAAHEYAFSWGMNIAHRWYVGLGLHIQSYLLSSDGDYYEYFPTLNPAGEYVDIKNESAFTLTGVGCNAAFGVIYRPSRWARVGLSLHTPSLGSVTIYTSGTFSSLTDTLRYCYARDMRETYSDFHMPLRLSVGAAFTMGHYGIASVQYDYQHMFYSDDTHAFRSGFEITPVEGLYMNVGYAWETTFKHQTRALNLAPGFYRRDAYSSHWLSAHCASAGIGYRGKQFIVQAAYQYRWQSYNYHVHPDAYSQRVHADTHRFVITIGWHRAIL